MQNQTKTNGSEPKVNERLTMNVEFDGPMFAGYRKGGPDRSKGENYMARVAQTYIAIIRGGIDDFDVSIQALHAMGLFPGQRTISDLKAMHTVHLKHILNC